MFAEALLVQTLIGEVTKLQEQNTKLWKENAVSVRPSRHLRCITDASSFIYAFHCFFVFFVVVATIHVPMMVQIHCTCTCAVHVLLVQEV